MDTKTKSILDGALFGRHEADPAATFLVDQFCFGLPSFEQVERTLTDEVLN